MEKLDINIATINLRDIEESPLNAQEMKDKDFNRLVKNIKKDGVLTSSVLLMKTEKEGKYMCISGHHRIKAAKKAGIKTTPAIITPKLNESTRIRLQLTHNDIHGEPNENILSILQNQLNEVDTNLVDLTDSIANTIETYQIKEIETFQYISICLKPESYEELIQLISSHSVEADTQIIIEKEEYNDMREALTIAFKNGFKTTGKAFRKFIDIVLNHKEELEQ